MLRNKSMILADHFLIPIVYGYDLIFHEKVRRLSDQASDVMRKKEHGVINAKSFQSASALGICSTYYFVSRCTRYEVPRFWPLQIVFCQR